MATALLIMSIHDNHDGRGSPGRSCVIRTRIIGAIEARKSRGWQDVGSGTIACMALLRTATFAWKHAQSLKRSRPTAARLTEIEGVTRSASEMRITRQIKLP